MDAASRAGRVLFEDVKPYAVPAQLADLDGPAVGVLRLPITVYWGPQQAFGLSRRGEVRTAYEALLCDGRVEDQVSLLNRHVLIGVWTELLLPARVRTLWEYRFSELAATPR